MNNFNYVIREYNEDEKFIIVDYDDGSWARIDFVNKIPSSQSELDDIVSRYTKSKEQIEITKLDDSFVKRSIGKSHEAQRFSFAPPPSSTPAPTFENPYADALNEAEDNAIEEIVTRILIKKGIISE